MLFKTTLAERKKMNPYSAKELSDFRFRLVNRLEETIALYQDLLKNLEQLKSRKLMSVILDKDKQLSATEEEKLRNKAGRLRKYIQHITNTIIRIDNGTYFYKRLINDTE